MLNGYMAYSGVTLVATYYSSSVDDDSVLTSAGSFDGYFYSEGAFADYTATAVRGLLTVKLIGQGGKLTAKAVLQRGSLSFRAAAWAGTELGGTCRVALTARSGETLDLYVRQNRIWGTLTSGALGETLALEGARNRFAHLTDAAVQTELGRYPGYYTVALPAYDSASASKEVAAAPEGVGYLTVTVDSKGAAKIAGVLADGTKITQSSRLILFGGDGACVPLFAPLYMRRGWVGGLLWIDPEARTVVTAREQGWFVRWENPGKAGPDGFSQLLDACGGYYSSVPSLVAMYLFDAPVGDAAYYHSSEIETPVAVPDGVQVSVADTLMTMVKGAMPRKMSVDGVTGYEYDGANPANATLLFTARTGLFKGKFNLYYDYLNAFGLLQHKRVSVNYAGVLTPVRAEAFAELPAGLGHCLVPYSDPVSTAYRLKRSSSVYLRAQE